MKIRLLWRIVIHQTYVSRIRKGGFDIKILPSTSYVLFIGYVTLKLDLTAGLGKGVKIGKRPTQGALQGYKKRFGKVPAGLELEIVTPSPYFQNKNHNNSE